MFGETKHALPFGNSQEVQWLGLGTFILGPGSVPGGGTKIPQTAQHDQEKKKKQRIMKGVFLV